MLMGNKRAAFLWAAAALLCMVAIFVFSAFPAERSSGMSDSLVDWPFALFEKWFGVSISLAAREFLHRFIRKAAHLLIFLLLGVCAANTVRRAAWGGWRVFWISLCWCSLYAATDEFHQLFVPGRACMWQDWLLDTAGALIGIGAVLLFMRRGKTKAMKK